MKESNFIVMISNVLCFFLVLLVFGSCSQKSFDDKDELMAYVSDPDNGYTQQKSIKGVDFSLTYRPTDMLVQQELMDMASKNKIDSLRKKYGEYMYFNLSISKNNKEVLSNVGSSRTDFGAMVNQLAFGMGEKVHLISQNRDTITLADYIYPRLYGMGGGTSILFVYPREKKILDNEFFQFTIEDIGLKTGEVGFKMSTDPIINEPILNLIP